jgi:hypothetical protein
MGSKRDRKRQISLKLAHGDVNSYDSTAAGSLHATAQCKISYLKIPKYETEKSTLKLRFRFYFSLFSLKFLRFMHA